MSVMNVELYDALVAAGTPEDKARAAASSVGDINQLVTKSDIGALPKRCRHTEMDARN